MKARTHSGGRRPAVCNWAWNPYGGAEFARDAECSSIVTTPLLEQVLARENLRQAWERVRANRGGSGY